MTSSLKEYLDLSTEWFREDQADSYYLALDRLWTALLPEDRELMKSIMLFAEAYVNLRVGRNT